MHEDITHCLAEHARTALLYEKQLLKELEALRPDFSNVNKRAADIKVTKQSLLDAGAPVRTNSAPDLPRMNPTSSSPTVSPGPPLSPPQDASGPPLARPAARMDGTQSMFLPPSAQSGSPTSPDPSARPSPGSPNFVAQRAAFPSQNADPLGAGGSYMGPSSPRKMEDSIHGRPGQRFGPGTNTLARSTYVQPSRSKLDAREAAAKLANFL